MEDSQLNINLTLFFKKLENSYIFKKFNSSLLFDNEPLSTNGITINPIFNLPQEAIRFLKSPNNFKLFEHFQKGFCIK